jgi:hypothetical protein
MRNNNIFMSLLLVSWRPSGTLVQKQGYLDLVKNYGHKGPVLRSRCIRNERA